MNKKSVLVAALGALSLGLTATTSFAQAAPEKKVLMVLWRGMTEWEKPFQDKLAALGVKATFTEVVGNQDRAVLGGKLRELEPDFAAKKYDVIYSFGTIATQMTEAVVLDRIPIIFNIVFDPVGGKLVKSMQEPGVNATGATNGVPMADQFDAFNKLSPIKSLAFLFNAREANANLILDQVSAWATKHNVKLVPLRVAPEGDSLTTTLADIKSGKIEADSLYAGADSYLGSVSGQIKTAIGDKVRLYGGTQTFVQKGWLAAYTPTADGMGAAAAELMAKVLAGQPASKLPVVLPKPAIIVSKAAAAQHNVVVPADAVTEP